MDQNNVLIHEASQRKRTCFAQRTSTKTLTCARAHLFPSKLAGPLSRPEESIAMHAFVLVRKITLVLDPANAATSHAILSPARIVLGAILAALLCLRIGVRGALVRAFRTRDRDDHVPFVVVATPSVVHPHLPETAARNTHAHLPSRAITATLQQMPSVIWTLIKGGTRRHDGLQHGCVQAHFRPLPGTRTWPMGSEFSAEWMCMSLMQFWPLLPAPSIW